MKAWSLDLIFSKVSCDQPQVSNLFTATTSSEMPRERTSWRCSLVWPPRSNPASKCDTSATSSATSACTAPCSMFGTKSRWPGASRMVKCRCGVVKCFTQTSMVTPRCRSSSPSSRTQAKAKEAFPICLDSFSNLCSCFEETDPTRQRRCPIKVDFPASTWPTTTRLTLGRPSSGAAAAAGASAGSSASAGSASALLEAGSALG
mmetsp:Transcript_97902/g.285652  ORF Transcript_97902/g.285652 Transcript_97902/m.285652 type:complete len:204 (+) Transcript_97902:865-1476(+)